MYVSQARLPRSDCGWHVAIMYKEATFLQVTSPPFLAFEIAGVETSFWVATDTFRVRVRPRPFLSTRLHTVHTYIGSEFRSRFQRRILAVMCIWLTPTPRSPLQLEGLSLSPWRPSWPLGWRYDSHSANKIAEFFFRVSSNMCLGVFNQSAQSWYRHIFGITLPSGQTCLFIDTCLLQTMAIHICTLVEALAHTMM